MIDAVLSYHLNPLTCGVAKFNHELARRLGVPLLPLNTILDVEYPLLSIKPSELNAEPCVRHWRYAVFLHGSVPGHWSASFLRRAVRVFAANAAIHSEMRGLDEDIETAACPATVAGNPTRGAYNVLTFGMAHKLVLPHFAALKVELDREHPDYTISLSTAVHEGSPWDTALRESTEAMRGIFGDKLRVLGFLADDALAKELQECDAVAAYFTPALRANNTSYFAAIEAGKPVYTDRDEFSPKEGDPPPTWDNLISIIRGTDAPQLKADA